MDGNTNKVSTCEQCSQVIARGPNCIRCEGFCTGVFHASCVKMSIEDLLKYQQSPNMWWMCDSCSNMMIKQRNNRHALVKGADTEVSATKPNEISRIDDEIAALKKQIIAINQSLSNSAATSPHTGPSQTSTSVNQTIVESSHRRLPETQLGTNTTGCSNTIDIVEQTSANDRFWLFLSRVKNRVVERQISQLVSDALGTTDVIVKKLVPQWKDPCSMLFISFKVSVHVSFKETALFPYTWPSGMHFRKFRDGY